VSYLMYTLVRLAPISLNLFGHFFLHFSDELRAKAGSAGSRLARSKHQIGTLFYNAKMNEIDLLEGKARSMLSKKETQAKYGW
jgi:hypothetical protein